MKTLGLTWKLWDKHENNETNMKTGQTQKLLDKHENIQTNIKTSGLTWMGLTVT